jgi:hypothetical protein
MGIPLEKGDFVLSPDRRINDRLRLRFDAAMNMLQPLLGDPGAHNGAAFYRAMTRLQSAHPDLSSAEIEALVTSVVRAYQSRASNSL